MRNASFITSDPGHAEKDRPHGEKAKTRRCKDGAWAKKGTKSYFGYKLHGAMNEDLANESEARYADKGYFGEKTKGYDVAMRKVT